MDPLAVTGHLAADDSRSVGVLRRAPDPSDTLLVDQFDFKRTSGGAVVWTGAIVDVVGHSRWLPYLAFAGTSGGSTVNERAGRTRPQSIVKRPAMTVADTILI